MSQPGDTGVGRSFHALPDRDRDQGPQPGDTAPPDFLDLLRALPAAIYLTDAAGRITFYNDAAAALWGHGPELGKTEFCGSSRLFRPDGTSLPHDQCPMAIALKEQRPVLGMEIVIGRPDGSRVPVMPYPTPIFDREGRLTGAVNMLVDLSQIKRGEEAKARLAAIVESSHDAIVSKDLEGGIISWNASAARLFGYAEAEAVGRSIRMLIPADLQNEEDAILDKLRHGERIENYETIRRRKDGTLVDVSLSVSPVLDATGRVTGAAKIARDITANRQARDQRDLLLREMNHRVKNLFALCRGIISLSRRSAQTVEELATAILGRLQALASAHDLTLAPLYAGTAQPDNSTTLAALIRAIVAPYLDCDGGSARITESGPEVPVGSAAASGVALVLHELATNAAKYGALSSPEGQVRVEWSVDDGLLRLCWAEHGGPPVDAPSDRDGFGSLLVRQTVTGQFGGEIDRDWQPDGLVVRLTLGVDRLAP